VTRARNRRLKERGTLAKAFVSTSRDEVGGISRADRRLVYCPRPILPQGLFDDALEP
jgi:hypothetical protein